MKSLLVKPFLQATLLVCAFVSFQVQAEVKVETWQTSKGTKVLFVQADQLPMLDIEMTFDAGSARDGQDWGLATFTSGLIGTATSKLDEDQISQKFNEIGSQFGSDVGRDNASLSLRTLTRPNIMKKSLTHFAEVIADAQFKKAVIEREMKRLKISLQQRSVKPQVIANDTLWKTLYGDHPYGHPTIGTLESVERITVAKIEQFYKDYYVASNAVIAMVGNVSKAQAKNIAEQLTQKLPTGKGATAIPVPNNNTTAKNITVEFDSTQTYYSYTQQGVERGHPDYISLFVGNHLLGGSGFGSFLMEEVREKRGLVYSVYSYFAPLKVKGPFIIGLSTKNASAYEADQVVKETFANYLKGFSDEKLQAIKDNLVGGFPLRIDSNGKILGYLSMIGFYDMPLDYLSWFPKEVEKVTKEDVLKAWNRLVKPKNMVTIMVGKPE